MFKKKQESSLDLPRITSKKNSCPPHTLETAVTTCDSQEGQWHVILVAESSAMALFDLRHQGHQSSY